MKTIRWLGLLKVFPFKLNYRACKHTLNAAWPFSFTEGHQSMVVFNGANIYFPQPLPHSSIAVQIDPHGKKKLISLMNNTACLGMESQFVPLCLLM